MSREEKVGDYLVEVKYGRVYISPKEPYNKGILQGLNWEQVETLRDTLTLILDRDTLV